jgi:PhnB protein
MLYVTPFLLFDGNCAEAMTFYQECLGGELTLTKLGDTPMKDRYPKEKHDRIINAHLKSGAIEITASDWMASPTWEPRQGTTVGIFVIAGQYDEIRAVFDRLVERADRDKGLFVELGDMPFGTYGQFIDRYGVPWKFKGDRREQPRLDR